MPVPRGVRLIALVLVAGLIAWPSVPARAQEVLTNESVIGMVKAGLPESVIVTKIRSTATKFDLSADALVKLKKAGVPDHVLEAMVGGGAPASAATAGATAPGAKLKDRDVIYHAVGDQLTELQPAVAQVESNVAFYTSKSEIVLEGRKAALRIAERQPVFLSGYSVGEAPLVRLKPGDSHDDRNLKVGGGSVFSSKIGIRSEDKVEVVVEKDSRGLLRVTPKSPLPPGEYGFVLMEQRKVYDFGVD